MKKVNGFWVDTNYNKWNSNLYSKEEALKYSASLIDCSYCSDCIVCSNCSNCNNCSNCSYCSACIACVMCGGCSGCNSCSNCSGCKDCNYCMDCSYCNSCRNCNGCWDCKDCSNCIECNYCNSFCKNPERIIGSTMGSRSANPAVYWVEVGEEQCVVGCFHGTLDELEKAVEKTHKHNEKYLNEYKNFITKVRAYQGVLK